MKLANKEIEQAEVSKLVSLTPKRYKNISLEIAIINYCSYKCAVFSCFDKPKTFKEWLLTEI